MRKQSTETSHPKSKNFFYILVLIIIIIVALGGYKFYQTKTTKIGFEDIGELSTQVAYCEEIGVTDEARTLFGIKIPFTQSKYIYSYNVTIKAGYNFEDIDYTVNEHTKKIKVRLPKVKITGNQIDEDSFKVYHEDESIFRRISLQENNKELNKLKKNAEKDAISNGLYENARSNAETILKGFFSKKFDLDEYTIMFVNKK